MTSAAARCAPTTTHTTDLALKALRLPSMARSWHEIANEATTHAWTHERFLAALCELELTERTCRRLAARLMAAKLPPGKRLDSFEFNLVPGLSRSRIEALAAGDWIRSAGNCLLFGGSGTGKSHLAAAIGYGLIETGYSVLFARTTDLVQRLQAARRDLALPALLSKLDRIDCLILDDLGYVRKDQSETSILFELIAERYVWLPEILAASFRKFWPLAGVDVKGRGSVRKVRDSGLAVPAAFDVPHEWGRG